MVSVTGKVWEERSQVSLLGSKTRAIWAPLGGGSKLGSFDPIVRIGCCVRFAYSRCLTCVHKNFPLPASLTVLTLSLHFPTSVVFADQGWYNSAALIEVLCISIPT